MDTSTIRKRTAGLALLLGLLPAAGCGESVAGSSGGEGTAASPAADDPKQFGTLSAFSLVDQRGEAAGLETLLGRPFVAAAIFTTCYGPCPEITRSMRRLQDRLEGTGVRLVSISVDPETDTPEVLAAYGAAAGADFDRWTFLTGAEEEIHRLLREGFYLSVARAPEDEDLIGMQVTHATQLVCVDGLGRLRGWYDGTDPAEVGRCLDRLLFLDGEAP